MARKKKSKALFELLTADDGESQKKLDVPGWFGAGKPVSPVASEQEAVPAAPSFSAAAAPAAAKEQEERERAFAVIDGKLQISLSTGGAALVALGALVLIVGAFVLGRRSVSPGVGPDVERVDAPRDPNVRNVGPVPVPGSTANRRPPRPSSMKPDDAPREKGYYYLVIQSAIPDYAKAYNIKRFLHSKGIDATVHKSRTNLYMVKDLKGFKKNAWSHLAVREYVDQIERLGREYMRQADRYNKYDFRQGRGQSGPYMIYER